AAAPASSPKYPVHPDTHAHRKYPPSACRSLCPASKLHSATTAANPRPRVRLCHCYSRHSSKTTSSSSPDPAGSPSDPTPSTRLLRRCTYRAFRCTPSAADAHRAACFPKYRSRCPYHKNAEPFRTPLPTGCDTPSPPDHSSPAGRESPHSHPLDSPSAASRNPSSARRPHPCYTDRPSTAAHTSPPKNSSDRSAATQSPPYSPPTAASPSSSADGCPRSSHPK